MHGYWWLGHVIYTHSWPWVREICLVARLHTFPHIGLRCILEIEILFNRLSLQLSDFQLFPVEWSSTMEQLNLKDTGSYQ